MIPSRTIRIWHSRYLLFAFLLACFWLVTYTVQQKTDSMQKELIELTLGSTRALNNIELHNLTFEQSDTSSRQFQQLQTQLNAVFHFFQLDSKEWKISSVYTIHKQDTGYLYGPASSHRGSEISNYGAWYSIPQRKIVTLDNYKSGSIYGPYKTSNGSFLTVFAPVKKAYSQKTQFLLAIELPANQWYNKIIIVSLVPCFLLVFSLILVRAVTTACAFFCKNSYFSHPEVRSAFSLGLLLTVVLSYHAYLLENSARTVTFSQLCKSHASLVTDEISDIDAIRFESFNQFFDNSQEVNQNEFSEFTQYLSRDPSVQAWGWITVVHDSDSVRNGDMVNDSLHHDSTSQDTLNYQFTISSHTTRYQLQYMAPLETNESLSGFDMGTNPVFLSALQKAAQSEESVIIDPIAYFDGTTNSTRAFVFHPVYSHNVDHTLKGFTFITLDYSKLILYSTYNSDTNPEFVSLTMYDISKGVPRELTSTRSGNQFNKTSQNAFNVTHTHRELITAFGNSFIVIARPDTALLKLYPLTTWWLLIGGGTILTVLLSIYIGSLKNHRTLLEEKVRERTAALQESEERFSQISELCGEIIWEVDKNGTYTYISPPCTTLLGYNEDEIINKLKIFDLHPDMERDAFHSHFVSCVSQQLPFTNLYTHLESKNGHILHIISNAAPVINHDGTLRGYRGSDLDISATKLSEVEKEKLQTELVQAQKMESIGRLAGGIAHDFNNMLCTIIGNTEIAMEQCRDKDVCIQPLVDVLKAAERSSDLTRQLLAFARKQIVNPVTLDINNSISSIYKMLKRLIGENIDLKWIPGNNLLNVKIDSSQIDQILTNIVVNARDAISGIGTIVIETAPVVFSDEYCSGKIESRPGKYTMIAVSDNGSGMDKETLSHLFEPFFTTKALGQGTGLGLATVYGIVKQNGGFIHVYSESVKGTSFRIYLPGIEIESPVPKIDTKTISLSGGSETILVVEDERSILDFIDITLRKLGYNIVKTTSPHEAIEAAKAQKSIHLVLTDVILPKMNGKELVLQLKAIIPEIKCLYMSGYTANFIAHHGILDEGINFLQKPFNRTSLSEKIRSILDEA